MIPPLAAGRALAGSTLTDHCTITRVDRATPRTVDPDTLELTWPPDLPVWSGPCSVSPAGAGDGQTTSGGTDGRIGAYVVRIPADAPLVQGGDAVTIDAIGSQGIAALIDRTFTVEDADVRTTAILRRLTCVEPGPGDGIPQ